MKKAVALAKSQLIARHLGDAPANWLNPVKFAQIAEELGKDFGFKVTILDKNDIEKEKMVLLMALLKVLQMSLELFVSKLKVLIILRLPRW